jgi:hypothetical protein
MIPRLNDCWSIDDHENIIAYSSNKLWRFIQQYSSIQKQNLLVEDLTGLQNSQLHRLASIHLLLSEDIQIFVEEIAPNILKKLSKTSKQQTEVIKGRIKGNVKWTRTVLKQRTEKNPSVFVCTNRSNIFDLIENRVLLYCLNYIYQMGQFLISKGLNIGNNLSTDYTNENQRWANKIQSITNKCNSILKNPLIRSINEIHKLNEQIIQKTKNARGQNYFQLAGIARIILEQRNQPIKFLYRILSKQILQPLSKDTLYEIAILFRLIDYFKVNGWDERKVSLIGEGQRIVSLLCKNNFVIKIYYQQLPQFFAPQSLYKELMEEYQLSIQNRRPDIILEWKDESGIKKYTIIEVKRSKNRSYLADGLYKVLGYLKDFEIPMKFTNNSKGLLVGWFIKDIPSPSLNKELYITDWSNFSQCMSQLEKNVLG